MARRVRKIERQRLCPVCDYWIPDGQYRRHFFREHPGSVVEDDSGRKIVPIAERTRRLHMLAAGNKMSTVQGGLPSLGKRR